MSRILVSGLINLETTARVEGFPIQYSPVRYPFFGIKSTISGVGFNVAKALAVLGDRVELLSLVGQDLAGELALGAVRKTGLPTGSVIPQLAETPQSVILYDPVGRRQINVDLKDIQEATYPQDAFHRAFQGCSLAVLCNINFSRPFLGYARQARIPIATDVHALADLEDGYNRDFMASADVLFMSDENLPCSPEEWARRIQERYGPEILVIGLGSQGALLAVLGDRRVLRFPAVHTRPVVNTIGAGDALFSCFVHFYHAEGDPYVALEKALVFASYKIGEAGAADGFLDEPALERLWVEGRS